ncbi:Aste57867_16835 [Aphanomyces stellatus]|uniref:Aste57867_16835 protein n=1 Tax=Aphanomyces stellatus TaxID=120398 RepID=A0A485L894_9STRA|nr:hypothetical protein As57867_016777 [Aphanomyces stellatus]VFT93599.1 Aste57867_16835 [Aphanomyces stellatus]
MAIEMIHGARGDNNLQLYIMSTNKSDMINSLAFCNSSRCVYLSPTVSEVEATALGELIGSSDRPLVPKCNGARRVVEAFSAAYCRRRQPAARFHWKEDLVLYV